MNFIPNPGQRRLINDFIPFTKNYNEQVFEISGGPGTGKSTIMQYLARLTGVEMYYIAPMAYTGAASIVMRLNGFPHARTIHSWTYRREDKEVVDKFGHTVYDTFFNRPLKKPAFEPVGLPSDIIYVFVDEAGSVAEEHAKQLFQSNAKIVACGDVDQLPPVTGERAFFKDSSKVHYLDQIMRQGPGSNIIYLANRAKLGLDIQYGYYGDCYVTDEDDLTDEMLMYSDIVICGTNKKRDEINKRVREIKGLAGYDLPARGEQLVCRKNDYRIEIDGINLANGLIGRVISAPDASSFDGKTFDFSFKPNLFNGVFTHLRGDYEFLNIPCALKKSAKMDKYNPGQKFEFAYAITSYIAQGSQFNNGIYIEEYLSPEINDKSNYVGITRFKRNMIYIKRKRKFYNIPMTA